jgi:hypothetical protein
LPSFSFYILFVNILILSFVDSGEEEEEPAANMTAPTSTSQTLVLSETRRATEEASPPQQDLEMSTPVASPRAPSPKRARIELGEEHNLTGSSAAPPLDDVRILATFWYFLSSFCRSEPFLSSFFLQPLMQHFISLSTQFIGYRDTVNGLKGTPSCE